MSDGRANALPCPPLATPMVLTNALGRNLISIFGLTHPLAAWLQIDISPCSYKPSQVPDNTIDSTLLGRALF